MNQSKLEVITSSCRRKARVTIGFGFTPDWIKKMPRVFLSQSCSIVDAKAINFRHSNENRSKYALTLRRNFVYLLFLQLCRTACFKRNTKILPYVCSTLELFASTTATSVASVGSSPSMARSAVVQCQLTDLFTSVKGMT